MRQVEMMGLMNRVIEYQTEDHSLEWNIQFFADLIATGLAWRLEGHIGRALPYEQPRRICSNV